MKLLLENWRKFTESVENPELSGNCGMVAISIYEEAERRGLDPMLVFVHNADIESVIDGKLEGDDKNEIAYGAYDLYHVAVEIRDEYYDDRGKISREDLNFDDFGEEDEDYYVDKFYLNDTLRDAIKRNTNRDKCPADFEKRALEILDNEIRGGNEQETEVATRGDCGVFAVSLIDKLLHLGVKDSEVVIIADPGEYKGEKTPELKDYYDLDIFHILVFHDGNYYDINGKTTIDNLLSFIPFGGPGIEPANYSPQYSRDFISSSFVISSLDQIKTLDEFVNSTTNVESCAANYDETAKRMAQDIFNSI